MIDKFLKQWDKNEEKLLSRQEKIITQAASQVYKETVDRTPFGRPELWRNNNAPSNYTPGGLKKAWEINWGTGYIKASGSFTGKLNAVAGASNYTLGNDIIMRNQEPYAYKVEFGWSRRQAPAGMARISVRSFSSFLNAATKKNKL